MAECTENEAPWLMLIHQIPPKPGYFRVKIWRRLQGLGAVAIKNSVYVIPRNEETLEDFQWVLREIIQGGGEASLCVAHFVQGLTDDQVRELFQSARDADYAQLAEEARELLGSPKLISSGPTDEQITELSAHCLRLKKRFAAINAIDFFKAEGRETAESLIASLELNLTRAKERPDYLDEEGPTFDMADYQGRTWVTRKRIYVDRIASAWLVRRFIDPQSKFRYVSEKGYRPEQEEIRFDMFDAEFTHEGDSCTFEVLAKRFGLDDPALRPIAEIVHALDLKEAQFKRAETAGIGALLDGLVSGHDIDEERLEHGTALFDNLYQYFANRMHEGDIKVESESGMIHP